MSWAFLVSYWKCHCFLFHCFDTLLTSETVQSSLEIPWLWILLQVQPGQSITIAVSTPKKTKFTLSLFPRERGGNNVTLSMPKVA